MMYGTKNWEVKASRGYLRPIKGLLELDLVHNQWKTKVWSPPHRQTHAQLQMKHEGKLEGKEQGGERHSEGETPHLLEQGDGGK